MQENESNVSNFERYPKVSFILEDTDLSKAKEVTTQIHNNFITEQACEYQNTETEEQPDTFTYENKFEQDGVKYIRLSTAVYLGRKWVYLYTEINTETEQFETGLLNNNTKSNSRLARDVGQRICKKTAVR